MSLRPIVFSSLLLLLSCSENSPKPATDSVRDTTATVAAADSAQQDTSGTTATQTISPVRRIGAQDYSIELPAHMQQARDLNRSASLQYMNPVRELYIIVLDESKADVVKAIRESGSYDEKGSVVQNYRMANLRLMDLPPQSPANIYGDSIGGLPANIVEVTAPVKGYMTHYKLAFVEGGKRLYTVMTWTIAPHVEENSEEMKKMLLSFRVE